MTLVSFLKLVEIQTKVASVIPFLLGTSYALYRFGSFNLRNFIYMFISLLAIDMATTAINNFIDYKKALKTYGYNYESHNAMVRYKLSEGTALTVIFTLLAVATVFGFLLFLNTNIIVLLLGALSFLIGVSYSFGPVPISRTPLGEVFSGLFMGFVITFISVYIHVYDSGILSIAYQDGMLQFNASIPELLYIFLISFPAVVGIGNIMLANNICDIEDDIENKRYTLPIYIGRAKALQLFRALYYAAYIVMLAVWALKAVPFIYLLGAATVIPVAKNIKLFFEKQTKKDTFVLSVKNFVIMNGVQVVAISAAVAARYLGMY